MKKILLTAAVIIASMTASAQVVTVSSVDRIGQVGVEKAVISSDGTFVVGYAPASQAIVKVDASGETTEVIRGESLYNVRLTGDQSNVVFSRPVYNNKHMRKVSLEAASLSDGKVQVLVKPTRNLNHGMSLAGSTVAAVEKGKVRTKTLVKGAAKQEVPFASISFGHLQVTSKGKTVTLDPQGRGSYLWPSVSPDGTKVLYWLVGSGCFVANIDGSNPVSLGSLRSAVFAGNDIVIGARQKGTAQTMDESVLVAKRLSDGATQELTSTETLSLNPSASADGSRVAFTNGAGEIYVLTLTK